MDRYLSVHDRINRYLLIQCETSPHVPVHDWIPYRMRLDHTESCMTGLNGEPCTTVHNHTKQYLAGQYRIQPRTLQSTLEHVMII